MSVEENKEVIRKVEKAWGTWKFDELDQYFAPDFSSPSAVPGVPPGLEGAKMVNKLVMESFPDRTTEIVDIVAEGDKVALRMRSTGTNVNGAPWLNVSANGKKFDFEWMSIYRLKNGKIVEHHGVNDVATLMQQIGD